MADILNGQVTQDSTGGALLNGTLTEVARTVPMSPPLGSCGVWITALVEVSPAADNATIALIIVRNPDSEALEIAGVEVDDDFSVATTIVIPVMGADQVPDGRDVVYACRVNVIGGTGDGTFELATISAIMMSGVRIVAG